jgi:hypothetical protein
MQQIATILTSEERISRREYIGMKESTDKAKRRNAPEESSE